MAVYVIADPHLSFGTDKPMNIFRGWDRHAEKMKENWLAAVRPEDTVVLPGDISWAMTPEQALADLQFLHELPGTKIIGRGNHDYWWATMRKMTLLAEKHGLSSLQFLFNNAFSADGIAVCGSRGWFFDAETDAQGEKIILREAGRLRASLTAGQALGGTLTAFMHYPVAADGRVCAPLMEVLHEFGVKHCYFGHLHGQNTARYADFTVEEIRFSLVSADHLQFCPKRVAF